MLVEMVFNRILKEYQRFNSLAQSTAKDSPEKRAAALLHPLLVILEIVTDLVKISFITKQNTVFTQTSHCVDVNIIAVRKQARKLFSTFLLRT